jgi:hypothetical protein
MPGSGCMVGAVGQPTVGHIELEVLRGVEVLLGDQDALQSRHISTFCAHGGRPRSHLLEQVLVDNLAVSFADQHAGRLVEHLEAARQAKFRICRFCAGRAEISPASGRLRRSHCFEVKAVSCLSLRGEAVAQIALHSTCLPTAAIDHAVPLPSPMLLLTSQPTLLVDFSSSPAAKRHAFV